MIKLHGQLTLALRHPSGRTQGFQDIDCLSEVASMLDVSVKYCNGRRSSRRVCHRAGRRGRGHRVHALCGGPPAIPVSPLKMSRFGAQLNTTCYTCS